MHAIAYKTIHTQTPHQLSLYISTAVHVSRPFLREHLRPAFDRLRVRHTTHSGKQHCSTMSVYCATHVLEFSALENLSHELVKKQQQSRNKTKINKLARFSAAATCILCNGQLRQRERKRWVDLQVIRAQFANYNCISGSGKAWENRQIMRG